MRYIPILIFSAFCLVLGPAGNTAHAAGKDGQQDLIKKAESYLQGLDELRADFVQTTPQGNRLSGVFYLNRPGRLRFEYDGVSDFVVADGTFIYFYDSEIESQSHALIGDTLAYFLLREDLKLSDDVSVQNAYETDQETILTLVHSEDPDAGSLTLVFRNKPFQLHEWIVRDAGDNLTKVSLGDINREVDLDKDLFVYRDPKPDRPVYNE